MRPRQWSRGSRMDSWSCYDGAQTRREKQTRRQGERETRSKHKTRRQGHTETRGEEGWTPCLVSLSPSLGFSLPVSVSPSLLVSRSPLVRLRFRCVIWSGDLEIL